MKIGNLFRIVSIFILLTSLSCSKKSDPVIEEPIIQEKIFDSDLLNPTNFELQVFYDSGYNVINGDLGFLIIDTLIDLTKLSNLISVKGDVYFNAISKLETVEGLNNLQSVGGDLVFSSDAVLLNFGALSNLKTIGGSLIISSLDLIENLNGLHNLESISNSISINMNKKLLNLEGVKKIKSIKGSLIVIKNEAITSFEGFEGVTSVGGLNIWGNPQLKSLEGLTNIQSCEEGITLSSNINLIDFCAIRNIKDLQEQDYSFTIWGNKYNPSLEEIIAGNCSIEK